MLSKTSPYLCDVANVLHRNTVTLRFLQHYSVTCRANLSKLISGWAGKKTNNLSLCYNKDTWGPPHLYWDSVCLQPTREPLGAGSMLLSWEVLRGLWILSVPSLHAALPAREGLRNVIACWMATAPERTDTAEGNCDISVDLWRQILFIFSSPSTQRMK